MKQLARTLQVLLALLLCATAVGKVLDVPGFVAVIRTYEALPEFALWPVAVGMIAIEATLALLLALAVKPRRTATACALLHVAFATWAVIALVRGLHVPNCGCFGVFLVRPLTWSTVCEDGVVVAVSLLLWRLVRPPAS